MMMTETQKYQSLDKPAVGVATDGWDGVMYDGIVDVTRCVVAETYVIRLIIKTHSSIYAKNI